jgi:hypothetical protein
LPPPLIGVGGRALARSQQGGQFNYNPFTMMTAAPIVEGGPHRPPH